MAPRGNGSKEAQGLLPRPVVHKVAVDIVLLIYTLKVGIVGNCIGGLEQRNTDCFIIDDLLHLGVALFAGGGVRCHARLVQNLIHILVKRHKVVLAGRAVEIQIVAVAVVYGPRGTGDRQLIIAGVNG